MDHNVSHYQLHVCVGGNEGACMCVHIYVGRHPSLLLLHTAKKRLPIAWWYHAFLSIWRCGFKLLQAEKGLKPFSVASLVLTGVLPVSGGVL